MCAVKLSVESVESLVSRYEINFTASRQLMENNIMEELEMPSCFTFILKFYWIFRGTLNYVP